MENRDGEENDARRSLLEFHKFKDGSEIYDSFRDHQLPQG